jgi:hypothetical protein
MSRHYNCNGNTSTNICLQTHIAEWVGGDDNPEVSQELTAIDKDLSLQLDPEEMTIHNVPVTCQVRLLVSNAEWLTYLKANHPDLNSRDQLLNGEPSGPLKPCCSSWVRHSLFTNNVIDLTHDNNEEEEEEEEEEEDDKEEHQQL